VANVLELDLLLHKNLPYLVIGILNFPTLRKLLLDVQVSLLNFKKDASFSANGDGLEVTRMRSIKSLTALQLSKTTSRTSLMKMVW
jgi:hypothetical protein